MAVAAVAMVVAVVAATELAGGAMAMVVVAEATTVVVGLWQQADEAREVQAMATEGKQMMAGPS